MFSCFRLFSIATLLLVTLACFSPNLLAQDEPKDPPSAENAPERRGRPSAEARDGRRGQQRRGDGARRGAGGRQRGQRTRPNRPARPPGAGQAPATRRPANAQQGRRAPARTAPSLPSSMANQVTWRSIGPANMGGRITSIAVYEKDPCIWWCASASGGLLKTTNNGINFEHQFDDQATVSIGDVQVSQSNKDIVWVGTGENNPRNSVSWGDGVYKSTDGGKTWKNMGLKKTFQTGGIAIHPTNPDIVWVGSLGRLWGPNPERGLFKTTDGGETWKKILYVNDVTGVIDVRLNPKNPDELLVATYERKRDGFDGNDPVKRFGDGSGIYKSTNGGESFKKITKGLPSCKLGRIGLEYFEKDPKYVYAVIESEKIGKEPENYAFMGLRSTDADVGAKITQITKGKAAEKAGLKVDDIIVSVDKSIVTSNREMQKEFHKHVAGEKVKVVVSRDRKLVDLEMTLDAKEPPRRGRARSDFTGTLGGQATNLQDTQGPDGHEYGGIYMSKDGGESWTRINSLNPRPMYYSHIQVDPLDRNNIYLCGTSLYRSKDGGKTFTGDGGSDGIHVDHHAIWIDKRDPRHIILGNDGGIHVSYDAMEHWDHLNHVAIGQFYHVGIDSNLDYKVYGGLQDNGSWGGPARSEQGSGPVNSDWMRVGGGDGFITLVDPDDPEQIYFESQNGGMGSIHLGTGARGFVNRARERGIARPRFNWKTPFLLSPHKSKIHYSAGNYVFRSYNKGRNAQRISPEITNHVDKGAGSALSESAVTPGVLYVGTTDGALFVTRNGGGDWQPLFYSPVEPEKKEDAKTEKPDGKTSDEKKADTKKTDENAKGDSNDPISGNWTGLYLDDRIPASRANFEFTLKLSGNKITGELEGRNGSQEISNGKYSAETGEVSFDVESDRFSRQFSGTLKDGKMTGEMDAGRFQMEFEAEKSDDDPQTQLQRRLLDLVNLSVGKSLTSKVSFVRSVGQVDDPITGEWKAVVENENLTGGRIEFTIELKMDDKKKLSGQIVSPRGDSEIDEGTFDSEKNKIEFSASNESFDFKFEADVSGKEMNGVMTIGGAGMEADFTAEKLKSDDDESDTSDSKSEEQESSSDESKSAEKAAMDDPKDKEFTDKKSDDEKKADDGFTGKWSGEITGGANQDITMELKRNSDKSFSGVFAGQNSHPIESGKYDPETKELIINAASAQLTLQLKGKIENGVYEGDLDLNEGQTSMKFTLKKMSDDEAKETATSSQASTSRRFKFPDQPSGEKSLSKLMPGPRWVSSLEASKFVAARCYATFDGHRSDDDGVYVFVTNDYGQTWESLKNNLPDNAGSARVIREDVKNRNLLFLGCEFSSWYSIDAGETWTRIRGGLPTVSVHEFAIHPTGNDVVAGTHGRSLWVADVSILRQLSKESLAQSEKLYQAKDAIRFQSKPSRGNSGTRRFVGTNPNNGTTIAYSLGANARQVELMIFDINGDIVKTFETSNRRGLHVFPWNLTLDSGGAPAGRRVRRRSVPSGEYQVRLKVDGRIHQSKLKILVDPRLSSSAQAEVEKEVLAEEMREFFDSNGEE